MWQRYNGYVHGREPLLTMAYFCLSVLAWSARDWPTFSKRSHPRRRAAAKYAIELDVLDTLGRLTSILGDAAGGRKRDEQSEDRPPTNAEHAWVDAAIKALILQVGAWAADPSKQLRQLTMGDLPRLS